MVKSDQIFSSKTLTYFLQLTETMNYTQAAQLLGITQPALTQQIKKLEHAVGAQLFYLVGKKLHLSEAGQTMLATVKEINALLNKASDEIQQSSSATNGQITIGMLSSIDSSVITDFISHYYKLYPNIKISLYMFSRKEIWDGLENNRIDLAIMYLPDGSIKNWKPYASKKINDESLIFLHHDQNLHQDKITFKEASMRNWTTYPDGFYLKQLIKESFRDQLVDMPASVANFSTPFQLIDFAQKADVYTALPASFYYSRQDIIDLQAIPFDPAINFELSFVYRRDKIAIPRINNFINQFDQYLAKQDYNTRLRDNVKNKLLLRYK